MSTIQYRVTGMTCEHCEMAIRDEVGRIAGVDRVEVDAERGTLAIVATQPLDDADVLSAVDEAGYAAVRV